MGYPESPKSRAQTADVLTIRKSSGVVSTAPLFPFPLKNGDLVHVTGRIRIREEKPLHFEIVANHVELIRKHRDKPLPSMPFHTKLPSDTLDSAVQSIGALPGIGERTAMRLSLHLLKQPKDNVMSLGKAIIALAQDMHYCMICGAPCNDDLCETCRNPRRNKRIICVVENIRDQMGIENTGSYNGVYHILGGIISPINGIAPSDLRIQELVQRIDTLRKEDTEEKIEVIFALTDSVEGETTALYLHRILEPFKITTTTLARGLSFGSDLEYADPVTLGRSLQKRVPFTP